MTETRILLDKLAFPEAPRWRGDRLWLTDQHAHEVVTVDLHGHAERVVQAMDDRPGGLGFLPDGTPLVVGMTARTILRMVDGTLQNHSDISGLAPFHCNDMLVDDFGRAYVGNFGYDVDAGATKKTTQLVLVEPNGDSRLVGEELVFPNGMAVTPGRDTLIVAETFASRISAFDIEPDGSLTNHRLFAELVDAQPDGICLDAEGAVWFACTKTQALHRVLPSGEVVASIRPHTPPYAYMLGGPDRKTLFALGASTHVGADAARLRSGTVEVVEVTVPGAGLP